ncbi:hypothetical protein AGMMS4952_25430 [Spirochaetia bacterium]|nr:hypothetical protein AGMMS4952_25430 [Spirochaetia bacterium]
MKKIFVIGALVIALILAGCNLSGSGDDNNNSNNTPELPSLTINNQSSYILTDVKFSGISFSSSGSSNELAPTTQSVKQLTADLNKVGYITFVRKDIGIACRSEVISVNDQDYTFTLNPYTNSANSI